MSGGIGCELSYGMAEAAGIEAECETELKLRQNEGEREEWVIVICGDGLWR